MHCRKSVISRKIGIKFFFFPRLYHWISPKYLPFQSSSPFLWTFVNIYREIWLHFPLLSYQSLLLSEFSNARGKKKSVSAFPPANFFYPLLSQSNQLEGICCSFQSCLSPPSFAIVITCKTNHFKVVKLQWHFPKSWKGKLLLIVKFVPINMDGLVLSPNYCGALRPLLPVANKLLNSLRPSSLLHWFPWTWLSSRSVLSVSRPF